MLWRLLASALAISGLIVAPVFLVAQDKPARQQSSGNKSAAAAPAESSQTAEMKFVRIEHEKTSQGKKKPVWLQTAMVTYASPDRPDVSVTLIGAVHIAEKSYYQQLNEIFTHYDVLLYEMVADPKQGVPSPEERGSSPVSTVQTGMKDMLNLTFQLDEVDYQAANFIHADMSPEEFFESMNKRKEGMFQMLLRSVGSSLAMQGAGKSNDLDILSAMLSDNRAQGMKRALAEQFEVMDGQMAALQGDDGRSTLITERNAKAFEVMDEQLKAGKKKLAIFYGAGHLDDMHQKLLKDYHMQVKETKWLNAWDLK